MLARIADRYALAAVVSGRAALDARSILGLDDFLYIGNHGFELLRAGAEEPEPSPALAGKETMAAEFIAGIDSKRLDAAGLRLEDKGAIRALHWRGAKNEEAAEARARQLASEAEAQGLATHWGRKVLEVRPPVELDKGAGMRSVLADAFLDAGFYAGDDRTDLDGFRALDELVELGRLQTAIRVAVVSDETPAEVGAAADLRVAGPDGFLLVLEALA